MCSTSCVNAEIFIKTPHALQFNNQYVKQFLDSRELHARQNPHPPTHNLSRKLIFLSTIYSVQNPPILLSLNLWHTYHYIIPHICVEDHTSLQTLNQCSVSLMFLPKLTLRTCIVHGCVVSKGCFFSHIKSSMF
jgi:hypothetical protein